MVIIKENLSDLKERYEKAIKLFEEDSKHDLVTNPYKSAYEGREILIEIQHNLKNLLCNYENNSDLEGGGRSGSPTGEDINKYKFILGFVYKDLGRNYIGTEEFQEGEKYFKLGLDVLKEFRLKPEAVIAYLECLNELGLWGLRNDAASAIEYLNEAEILYDEFIKLEIPPHTIFDLFGTPDEIETGKGSLAFEKDHTLTIYYKAQALTKMEDLHNSAWYCHKTLKRQLEFNDFEPIDWALNAAVLSQYFFTHNTFPESRKHLAAAHLMMDNFEKTMITPEMTNDEQIAIRDKFNHRYADLLRCWAKYGIYILQSSKERLLEDEDDKKSLPDLSNLKIYSENLNFDTLDLSKYESVIIDRYCLTFDDAKPVFVKVLEWLNKSKEYYNSENEASEHAQIIQDLSSAYSHLAFFEEDGSNQCKLHKRRADLLEEITKQYNPTYYLKICREAWYELGLTYSKMLDIKLDILNDQSITERPTPHALNKINLLSDKSIQNFQLFIDSYKNIEKEDIDEQHAILYCFFHIGRMHYKKTTPDKIMQAKNVNNSLKYYNIFVEKVSANEELQKIFKAELGVCREMITLLPRKLEILLEEISKNS